MVPHRLGAQLELLGDLMGRMPVLEVVKHFGLTRRQRGVGGGRVDRLVQNLAEDADHTVAAHERHRAHIDRHALAMRVDEHDLGVGHSCRARHFPCEAPPTLASSTCGSPRSGSR
jgi:hypothetical protein